MGHKPTGRVCIRYWGFWMGLIPKAWGTLRRGSQDPTNLGSRVLGLGFKGQPYLDPEKPSFLGLRNMISLYKSLKRRLFGLRYFCKVP